MIHTKKIAVLIALLLLVGCQKKQRVIEQFSSRTAQIQQQLVPDLRLNVFDARLTRQEGKWVLQGETTVAKAREQVIGFADSLLGKNTYRADFLLLPHPDLGDSSYGIIQVSTAHLRDAPKHAAQLVDQDIMGKVVRLLKRKHGWYLVQTDYGYVGWMRRESFRRLDLPGVETWKQHANLRVTGLFTLIYSEPNENSPPVCDVVLNSLLRQIRKGKTWSKVATPDGRVGYIRSKYITANTYPTLTARELRRKIIATARQMMGIPYLWGGNSSTGNDCSGFTQTVFEANGIRLLRDAYQQAGEGKEIIPNENFSNVLPGDLLFFGSKEKIVHVGISLGGAEFIHQSGEVHINSLDPKAENYSPGRRKSLQKIVRVVDSD